MTDHRLTNALRNSSWLALAIACGLAQPAFAQTADQQQEQQDEQETSQTVQDEGDAGAAIVVVGTRASLRSAIERKRNAKTIVDSIVADDIASFPDKNVGDSLARITGVQLSRDFGEGVQVSIRGVEPDLNRVEINGVSQVSASGGRAGDFRELATELVKSIDVYKGYSVDITEGGIGGTVRIETRRPLELLDPIVSIVASEQYNELTETWKPRATLVAGTPSLFGNDRLGVLLNVTYDDVDTRQDFISNTNWKRIADFDHSTEKTVADPDYAAYDTYESCGNVPGGTSDRRACETQFFDWAPTVPRYRSWIRHDQRISGDFQVQYEVADNFRAHAEAQVNFRNQQLNVNNYSIDLGRYQRLALDPQLPDSATGAVSQPQVLDGSATVNENHLVTSLTTALSTVDIGQPGAPNYNGASGILGVQARDFSYDQNSQYYQTGFEWNLNQLHLEGLASHASATTEGQTNSYAFSTGISGIVIDRRNDLGTPSFIFPGSFDPGDPASYYNFNQVGADGQPLVQTGPTLQYRPTYAKNDEDQLKLDADWDVDLPFITRIEDGGQFRWQSFISYNGGGARLLQPAVAAVPESGIAGSPAVYQDTANVNIYTVITDTPPANPQPNTVYLTSAQYQELLQQTTGTIPGAPLFSSLNNAPSDAPTTLAVPKFNGDILGQYYDLSGFDHDLVFEANGLPQIPAYQIDESIASGYLMADYETTVFGMPLTGNFGVRYTHTRDVGVGTNVRRERRVRPGTGVNGVPAIVETATVSADSLSIANSYTDWLPAVNANLEITPTLYLRGNWAQNMARPRPSDLVPNVNCVFDLIDAVDENTCSAGNPDLEPYRANQWEVNLAWYPNPDTLVSIGYYKKNEKSFIIPNVTREGVDLFHNGTLYTVRQSVNGYGAVLDGIELSAQTAFTFLPSPLDGFGASANFTYARALETNLTNSSNDTALNDYPGLSKYTYNASIFYDKDWLNARLSYNYRSKWLISVSDRNNGDNPLYRKGEGYLDAKVTFRIESLKSSFFVEAQNLTKESSQVYIDADRPVDYYSAGRRFFVGFQVKM
jgi:TonB-dependent receptor